MEKRNSNILFTILICLCCFLGVVYTSCSKSNPNSITCENVFCQNGGICRTGKCVCPYGYEGVNCEKNFHDKYIGSWNVHETLKNDTVGQKVDSLYPIVIASSTTSSGGLTSPTSFFFQKMLGNPNYVNLSCVVDTLNTSAFYMQPNQSIDGGHLIVFSGNGSIDSAHNTITGMYVRNRLGSATVIYDTLTFVIVRQ